MWVLSVGVSEFNFSRIEFALIIFNSSSYCFPVNRFELDILTLIISRVSQGYQKQTMFSYS